MYQVRDFRGAIKPKMIHSLENSWQDFNRHLVRTAHEHGD